MSLSTRAPSPAYGCSFFVYVMSPGRAVSEAFNPAFVSDVSAQAGPDRQSKTHLSPITLRKCGRCSAAA